MAEVRILVVAADPLVRAGLAAALVGQPGFSVVGQVDGGATLAADLTVYRPDVLVWDLGWDSTAAAERLAGLENAGSPVVALVPEAAYASDAWAAGARGVVLREVPARQLVAAVSAVAAGLAALDPELAAGLLPTGSLPGARPVEDLTARELEVVRLLAEGLSNKEIARRLNISEHTVKFHVNAILGKLGAQSRTEAVVRATRLGLIIL